MLESSFPMKISIGADHAGFRLKERLRQKLVADGHQVADRGTDSEQSCDYPDFAAAVARDVSGGLAERGVLVCGSGSGMSIAANKISGVRAVLGTSEDQVRLTRAHNDANVLALGSRALEAPEAERLVDAFIQAEFEGGRHARRVDLIAGLERGK
jgi:ribose 5-phosphate isomerase B